jgi:putative mycofactocin binding protein MftB
MSALTVATPAAGFAVDHAYDLHASVSVREEDFGALLYHFGTRRLSFATSRRLLEVVRSLEAAPSAAAACDASFDAEPGSPGERAAVEAGLAALVRTGMLVERGEVSG